MTTLLEAYLDQTAKNQQQGFQNLQAVGTAQTLQQHFEDQASTNAMRTALSQSGGDPEKAMQAALRTGNVAAANKLAPLLKIEQDRKQREETPRLLAELDRQQQQPKPTTTEDASGNVTVQPSAPQNPQTVREQRINYLRGLSTIPQYANNPVAMQRVQSEIDRLSSVKPMVEHNFAVGNDMVQPHISYDEGRNWQPIPGSKPSHKFAAQITNDQMPSVTDDTVEMDAWRYLTDGTLPPNMGRGQQGAAQATKIRNRSAELAKEMGMAPDEIRFAQLTNKTGVQALGQLSRARAQILQFEKTANMNADLALKASEQVDRTQFPIINKALQSGRTELLGDPTAKRFHAAMETFVSEYARVMSGGYGAAQTAEGAQNRAHTLLNTSGTKEQVREVIDQLKAEMGNRVKALNDQVNEERSRIRVGTKSPGPENPAPAPVAPPKPVKDMTNAELMEYRRRLAGGK